MQVFFLCCCVSQVFLSLWPSRSPQITCHTVRWECSNWFYFIFNKLITQFFIHLRSSGRKPGMTEREGNTRESIIFLFHISAGLHAVPTARLHLCVNQLILGAAVTRSNAIPVGSWKQIWLIKRLKWNFLENYLITVQIELTFRTCSTAAAAHPNLPVCTTAAQQQPAVCTCNELLRFVVGGPRGLEWTSHLDLSVNLLKWSKRVRRTQGETKILTQGSLLNRGGWRERWQIEGCWNNSIKMPAGIAPLRWLGVVAGCRKGEKLSVSLSDTVKRNWTLGDMNWGVDVCWDQLFPIHCRW